jgi:ATP-dependent DNA helicase PIF1
MSSTFAFEARTWGQCIGTPVFLSRVFRQKDHGAMLSGIPERNSSMVSEFIDILSAMRTGKLTYNHISQLLCLSRPLTYSDGIEASQLYGHYLAYIPKIFTYLIYTSFPLRAEVEYGNNKRLAELKGCIEKYQAMDSSGYDVAGYPIDIKQAVQLLDRLVALQEISLKASRRTDYTAPII